MSKFEKLYKQICYTWTLRELNNLLLRNWKFTTMNAPILRQALRSDFTCVTGISASGKYFRKQVLLADGQCGKQVLFSLTLALYALAIGVACNGNTSSALFSIQ